MILQTLTQYYEDLLARGDIDRPGWARAKVSWGLELAPDGQLLAVLPLQDEQPRGKKTVLVPQMLPVPEPVKRSSGVAANFLCDNSAYLLGIDAKGKPERTAQCFAAAKALHLELLREVPGEAAAAVRHFFETWQPAQAAAHPALAGCIDDVLKGGNLIFLCADHFVQDDPDVQKAWKQYRDRTGNEPPIRCLVTGQQAPLARLHPSIKGVAGAQSSGASLVSFNADAFCSYGHEQGANAPVGTYAAFAYTQALNSLLADRDHVQHIGDTTVVCWAQGGDPVYQDAGMDALFFDDFWTESDLRSAIEKLAQGCPAEWHNVLLEPGTHFYVLGLAPNAARLSVRFFWQDSFAALARNVQQHYEDLNITGPAGDRHFPPSLYWFTRETVNLKSRTPTVTPRLSGDVLSAVLNGTPYPATLLNEVTLRIRAEQTVTRGRAAILKAYYLRKPNPFCPKEVLTVQLNEESSYMPYVLGRLFAVLEAVQTAANPNINSTIKDRYFNSACATPAVVFPTLIKLAQKHLQKLSEGQRIYYDRQITELAGRLDQPFPARLNLPEQGTFEIGYYHQVQKHFTKKQEV